MPRFSVVVPAYNAESTLADTLEALIAQDYGDWECVIVDDGSTDHTSAVASAYARGDRRIRVVHQENQGTAGAYNTGVENARGDFIVLCSADDILLPQHLRAIADFTEAEDGFDIYSTNGYLWRSDTNQKRLVYPPGTKDEVASLSLADVIDHCFYSVGAAYRSELFTLVGGYRVGVFGEDYDFWLRTMAKGARHRYLPQALSLHRVSSTQKSADLESAYRSDMALISHLRDTGELSPTELRVADETLRKLERMIARHSRPWPVRALRETLVQVVRRLLDMWRRWRLDRPKSGGSGGTRSDV